MKKFENKSYQTLNKKLNIYLENSNDSVYIDEEIKNKIWNNTLKELHQDQLKRNYTIRRRYKSVVTACLLLIMLISLDLSSNASLFKRLFHSINDNTIQFYTREYKISEENRDYELDNEIVEINDNGDRNFISPIIPHDFSVQNINKNDSGTNIIIYMCSNDNRIIQINQKYITDRDSTGLVKYNQDLFNIETFNNNDIEYNIIQNDALTISLFVIGDIEFEVQGNSKQEVLDITMSLHY
ncbi:hypothetical protein [Vallitalea guaymasensis]|uniref:hypothetical protein n=1 Tax=Vallitalea guaymasensis TaxID=1185412 RepID=UPI0023559417|nr:hypothetical protein [Vallitalea guaymasensis]